jgi:WD40 repeat protein
MVGSSDIVSWLTRIKTLTGHVAPITALDFNEPYGMLVTAGQDEVVKVWDLCDGEEMGQLRGHIGEVIKSLPASFD